MRTKRWTALAVAVLAATMSVGKVKSDETPKDQRDQADATVKQTQSGGVKHEFHAQRASKLMGMDVQNAQGEDLGEIEDFVIDLKTGKVRYVAVSFGGFLGVGDKLFAVPMSAMKMKHDGDDTHFVLNMDKQRLKDAPGFDDNAWPDFAAHHWSEVDTFYGTHTDDADDHKESKSSTKFENRRTTKSGTGNNTSEGSNRDSDNRDRTSSENRSSAAPKP